MKMSIYDPSMHRKIHDVWFVSAVPVVELDKAEFVLSHDLIATIQRGINDGEE